MSGQPNYNIDDMNGVLLSGEPFLYKDFKVILIQQKNYEVFKNGVKLIRLPANWSTYWLIEEMLSDEV